MPKKILVLAVILVVLVAASAILLKKGLPGSSDSNPLQKTEKSQIAKITVQRAMEMWTLERDGNVWKMTAPVKDWVEQTAVDPILNSVREAVIGSVISESASSQDNYAVTAASGARVQVYLSGAAEPAFDGYVGKPAAMYSECYFRFEGSNAVHLASDLPSPLFYQKADDLRVRRIMTTELLMAQTMTIMAPKNNYSIQKATENWIDAHSSAPIDGAWVVGINEKIKAITVLHFAPGAESPAELGFDKPLLTLSMVDSHNEKNGFTVGKSPTLLPTAYYVRVDGRETVLVVSKPTVDALLTALKTPPKKL